MSQDADAFWTLDLRAREIGANWQVYAGASNLFDYTQVEDHAAVL